MEDVNPKLIIIAKLFANCLSPTGQPELSQIISFSPKPYQVAGVCQTILSLPNQAVCLGPTKQHVPAPPSSLTQPNERLSQQNQAA
ncbi:hypothetical protein DPMN_079828 [Dreissena polymorpha]|uniref:Uncharacterized protein n=1 Tax=Dreissena polymorpha TaxID=45954 RepID=A0A9D3YPQ7_DREPO|nr:hypothetical protein DPMN_079828 [Dreissena polymorpha]